MTALAIVFLIVLVLMVLWGAAQVMIFIFIGAIIYLAILALIDNIKEWLRSNG